MVKSCPDEKHQHEWPLFFYRDRPRSKHRRYCLLHFHLPPNGVNPLIPKEIKAKGIIKRVKPPTDKYPHFGVAVEFLSGPAFIY